jgi:nitrite reductase/ring-hydroxylating ferredoxin subunit
MAETDLCAAEELVPGVLRHATAGRREIVLTRLPNGELRAFAARCPHHGAPLAAGCVGAEVAAEAGGPCLRRPGEVLRCPWHGFEFDLVSGAPLVEAPPGLPMRLHFYKVAERAGRVVLTT